jgi:Fe-S cluster assembly protein SufB
MPTWGGDLTQLDRVLDEIYYYLRPQEKMERSWDDVPQEIKDTFEKLGIPEAEQKVLAGVGAQYESEMVYHSLKKEWEDKGIIFESIEDGLRCTRSSSASISPRWSRRRTTSSRP